MITYEVTAAVEPGIAPAFERYMRETHIPDLLATGCFTGARFGRTDDGRYRTQYEAATRADLERYLAEHAGAMRGHVREHFPAGIDFSREEWIELERWPRRSG